jgi:hypothetical protein
MMAIETTNATETTALAIYRATENITNTNQLNLNTNLRVSNLEKTLKRYDQKHNELHNKSK